MKDFITCVSYKISQLLMELHINQGTRLIYLSHTYSDKSIIIKLTTLLFESTVRINIDSLGMKKDDIKEINLPLLIINIRDGFYGSEIMMEKYFNYHK